MLGAGGSGEMGLSSLYIQCPFMRKGSFYDEHALSVLNFELTPME